MSILVRLLKGCSWGREGDVLRVPNKVGLKLCEKGLALVHEWKPAGKRSTPDVQKGATNGA